MWRFKRWLYRGLTVLRWLLFPVLILALLLGMCMPAAADGYYSYSGKLYDLQRFNIVTGDVELTATLDGSYVWTLPSNQLSTAVGWDIPFNFTASAGDRLRITTNFYGWSWIGFSYMDVYAVTSEKKYILLGTFDNAKGSTSGGDFFQFFVDVDKTLTAAGSFVELEFTMFISRFDATTFNVVNADFSLSCGNPSSPESPAYPPPDGGSVSDLGAAESSLTDSAQDGIDKAGAAFAGVDNNLSGYLNGLLMCSRIMGAAMTKLPWLGSVIEISLALGLFASLLGLAAALIGASDRRAAAQARSDKSWKQTQSRYGPRFFRRRHK